MDNENKELAVAMGKMVQFKELTHHEVILLVSHTDITKFLFNVFLAQCVSGMPPEYWGKCVIKYCYHDESCFYKLTLDKYSRMWHYIVVRCF